MFLREEVVVVAGYPAVDRPREGEVEGWLRKVVWVC